MSCYATLSKFEIKTQSNRTHLRDILFIVRSWAGPFQAGGGGTSSKGDRRFPEFTRPFIFKFGQKVLILRCLQQRREHFPIESRSLSSSSCYLFLAKFECLKWTLQRSHFTLYLIFIPSKLMILKKKKPKTSAAFEQGFIRVEDEHANQ